jgi:hypothetical protein
LDPTETPVGEPPGPVKIHPDAGPQVRLDIRLFLLPHPDREVRDGGFEPVQEEGSTLLGGALDQDEIPEDSEPV